MILSGLEIITRQLVRNIRNVAQQQQPSGVDLTLRQISKWTSAATIDFDNIKRQAAQTSILPLFPRSSLWRSGLGISAGVVDAGYEGAMGALVEVKNPHGVVLYENSKLAQIVLEEMGQEVEGYSGVYQASTSSVGRDGAEKRDG
ncbi:dUTPase-like protein [Leptodontidium sp. MPI-SDFR-AT-0119]|nr:dUTPase-like protein [Leptodontidium sp. MPI-SDFR-AT-0119]